MRDLRLSKLADNLLGHSVKLAKGEKLIIDSDIDGRDLVSELVKKTHAIGGLPFVRISDETIDRNIMTGMTEELAKSMAEYNKSLFNDSSASIVICAPRNTYEGSDVPDEKRQLYYTHYGKQISDIRLARRWVLLNYPTPAMAQDAKMSMQAFEDFYFDVCTMDYAKMDKAMDPLKSLMEKTDKVDIIAPDTELSFSIKNMPAVKCAGEYNIPDGEIYTAPIRESVNGKIHFNIPSIYEGTMHNGINLTFKEGKVIDAVSSNTEKLNAQLDSDDAARYVGEFAFGLNPYITKPMNDVLFDEKIAGSIHMALGDSYDDCPNGNKSQIHFHWDMVKQGGDIYFDNKLIRRNGLFLPKSLRGLNPENLK